MKPDAMRASMGGSQLRGCLGRREGEEGHMVCYSTRRVEIYSTWMSVVGCSGALPQGRDVCSVLLQTAARAVGVLLQCACVTLAGR
jgi:hypothetical protein